MKWLSDLLLGGIIEKFTGPLLAAYQAKLAAETDQQRLAAEEAIKGIEAARDIAVVEASDRWSATHVGRLLIVIPFGLWWAAIYIVQILNPWFGFHLVVVDVPPHVNDMALVLIPAIVIGDAGALLARRIRR
ncbi:hypothetical protein EOS93_25135 [Rhizobium sp. RMa-01]|uniref:hypothetical protein n=1 Tax=unclassified Rhizobium TaxID=2613769 RepID=UPI0008D949E7|nr:MULTISPECIES: hypothetical protein [unclassified Rhizobium]OHV25109.1 hypothetical protein BBJ66_22700 [Rhizobium sp. RSm-3]RVU08340.1 hypothetical protein EOS93_25135 [Rhizobium sp. RMa-01]